MQNLKKILFYILFQCTFVFVVLAQPPSERILNRSFEIGQELDAPPWILQGSSGEQPLVLTDPTFAHTGKRFLSMGNKVNTLHIASQIVNIPNSMQKPVKFIFWLQINSTEPKKATQSQDMLAVTVSDTQGNLLDVLEIYGNKDRKRFATYRKQEFNLSKFIGQTIQIEFMAANSPLFPSTFRIDDVSLASPDFSITCEPNMITVAKETTAVIFVEIERVAGFTEEIEINSPKESDLKPLQLSIKPKVLSTKATRVSFILKVGTNSPSGTYKLIFTSQDNNRRIRVTEVTVVIL